MLVPVELGMGKKDILPVLLSTLRGEVVVPDLKLYFIPVNSVPEATYLTGFLYAPIITRAVSAYAAYDLCCCLGKNR